MPVVMFSRVSELRNTIHVMPGTGPNKGEEHPRFAEDYEQESREYECAVETNTASLRNVVSIGLSGVAYRRTKNVTHC